MNTNRSDKLGSTKGLKLFGSRRGLAPYNAVQHVRAYQKLTKCTIGKSRLLQKTFERMAAAVTTAAVDFHEFAKFLNHGPIRADLSLQHSMYGPMTGYFQFYDTGSPGVSVQDLTDLAQQYAYLHPQTNTAAALLRMAAQRADK